MINISIKYLISIILLIQYVFAQDDLLHQYDQGSIPDYYVAVFDTNVRNNDTLEIDNKKQIPEVNKKSKSLGKEIIKMIRGSIFTDSTSNKKDQYYEDFIQSEQAFLPYSGKKIGSIRLKTVDIFSGSVLDTNSISTTWLSKSANSIHINTRYRILYENLLFQVGDTLDPYTLADNARLLRRLPYIQDANILVIPDKNESDVVDIIVITQDVFSLGLNGHLITTNNFRLNLFDRNFLGLGSELNNYFYYKGDRDPAIGYEFKYQFYNIRGTFISTMIDYLNDFEREGWRAEVAKNYLNPTTKYAGGLNWSRIRYHGFNSVIDDYTLNRIDTWLGRSFLIKDLPTRENLVVGLRYIQDHFISRPFVSADSNLAFHNHNMILGNLTFHNVNYFKSNMILSFGKTEDVPVGFRIQFTAGFSNHEFKKRYYGGSYIGYAFSSNYVGYLLLTTEIGGFLYRDRVEDGLIRVRSVYFSHLARLGDYRLRQYVSANYTKGIKRTIPDKINIRNRNGIIGLSHESMEGMQRLIFNFETVGFTPWDIFGFKIAAVARGDVGFIGPGNKPPYRENIFLGFGLGFRIRNESLVFRTINFGISYYPNAPEGISHIGYIFSTSEPKVFERFLGNKPSLIQFK